MKIVFCDNSLKELINFRGDIISHFVGLGHEIVLVAPINLEIPVIANTKIIGIKIERGGMNPFKDICYLGNLYRIFRKEKPDYVFNYTIKPNIYGSIVAKILNIPSTSMVTGLGYAFNHNDFRSRIARILYKLALNLNQNVLVLNAGNLSKLVSTKTVKQEKIILLSGGEGINLSTYLWEMRTTFLSIGRVLYDKGYKELIEASKSIQKSYQDIEFQWLGAIDEGYPEFVPESQIMMDQKNGLIRYLGFSSDVKSYIRQADCIILPSYHEGMSRTLMEALALGKPIITTDIPGCRETVDEGKNGFLCKPRDSNSLEQAIHKFLKLPIESINNMSQYSRKKAESQFDIKNVIKIYEYILNNK